MLDTDFVKVIGIPGIAWLEEGPGGLALLRIQNEFAHCEVFLHGAHISSFRPLGGDDVLWMSPYCAYEMGRPLRGGIPICFPWFGFHTDFPGHPQHGFARTRMWDIESIGQLSDGQTQVVLTLEDDAETRALWPYRFRLEMRVTVGTALECSFTIENSGSQPFVCEEALHTYFAVSDPSNCEIPSLDGIPFIDRSRSDKRCVQNGTIRFASETVNVYFQVPSVCELVDAGSGKKVTIGQQGLGSVVVWNPWNETALKNPEILEAWNQYVCVESANCLDTRLLLLPGNSHRSVIQLVRESF
jgi:glucose-6-phosphate 1-epimerase